MALQRLSCCYGINRLDNKYPNFTTFIQAPVKRRRKKYIDLFLRKVESQFFTPFKVTCIAEKSHACTTAKNLIFDTSTISQCYVTDEIHFFRDIRNHFKQTDFSDTCEPYGPPLAILLPWKTLNENLLKKFIEVYGEKGFDVITVSVTPKQLMYPCVAGGAMNVVTDLMQYLNTAHKNRPYVFHGFSVGVYIYGEILAQCSDQLENYRSLMENVKGCLWDSPVDIVTVKSHVGKFFYPNNWLSRWRYNNAVKKHFKMHQHDSVVYWIRARNCFCNPIIKVPQVFFVSCTDLLSNPNTLQEIQQALECNGIQIFQKTWWDSTHTCHFDKYCYEYLYGMILFFNLSNLFPDGCGKYKICTYNTCDDSSNTSCSN